jgi:hypothetical protein
MTHYVVESTLKIPNAFYSLILDGWDITDFAIKGKTKLIPPEANLVEALVGRLQQDLMPGSDYTAGTFNEEVEAVLAGIGNPLRRPVTSEELAAMRVLLRTLLSQWRGLAPGSSLELSFAGPVMEEHRHGGTETRKSHGGTAQKN